jgi:sulfide:quinone oxidoreductase
MPVRLVTNGKRSVPLRVLIAGGGVAALECALALRHLAEERVDIELLAPETHFWYRPLAVVEPFGAAQLHGLELAQLAEACGARFTLGALASVDPQAHVARTVVGAEVDYDTLMIAAGAKPVEAIPGALTFRGPADTDAFSAVLAELEDGLPHTLVFALPGAVSWPLPLYELALQTAAHLRRRGRMGIELAIVTHEESPLALFGARASEVVGSMLRESGVAFHPGRYVVEAGNGALSVIPPGEIPADRVVALPRLVGNVIAGIPHDGDGFIPTDSYGRVSGLDDVFAAGDTTTFPIKQGGLAAQQADAAAQVIAADAGAPATPEPFRPVLRGLIMTGHSPAFIRTELTGGAGDTSVANAEPLWWPPGKIVGRYLAPFLAERAGIILDAGPAEGAPVDIRLPEPAKR